MMYKRNCNLSPFVAIKVDKITSSKRITESNSQYRDNLRQFYANEIPINPPWLVFGIFTSYHKKCIAKFEKIALKTYWGSDFGCNYI